MKKGGLLNPSNKITKKFLKNDNTKGVYTAVRTTAMKGSELYQTAKNVSPSKVANDFAKKHGIKL